MMFKSKKTYTKLWNKWRVTSNPCIWQQQIVHFQKKHTKYNVLFPEKKEEKEKDFFWFGHPATEIESLSRRHAASPRPHARTKRIRFPGWGTSKGRRTNPKPPTHTHTYKTTLWVIRSFGVGGESMTITNTHTHTEAHKQTDRQSEQTHTEKQTSSQAERQTG